MKRSEMILEMKSLYESIPEGASSYHICDVLLRKCEKLGTLPPLKSKKEGMYFSECDFDWEEEREDD